MSIILTTGREDIYKKKKKSDTRFADSLDLYADDKMRTSFRPKFTHRLRISLNKILDR